MKRPDRVRVAAWLVSGLCLATSAGVLVNRHAAFVAVADANGRAATELARARTDSLAVLRKPREDRFACVPPSATEETEFLIDLRCRAHLAGVSIGRWTSHSATYKKEDKTPSGDPIDPVLQGVTKIGCELQLDGPYPALRLFLGDLWAADRLFTVTDVQWNRTEHGSELAMTLNRYVAPAPSAPPTPAS